MALLKARMFQLENNRFTVTWYIKCQKRRYAGLILANDWVLPEITSVVLRYIGFGSTVPQPPDHI